MLNKILGLLLLAALPAAAWAQGTYFPQRHWENRQPAAMNMNAFWLDSAVRFAVSHETKTDLDLRIANLKAYANEPGYAMVGPMKPRGKPAGLILRHGYIVAQWGEIRRVDMTFSVTKSFLSTVAALALDQKLIESIGDRVQPYVEDNLFDGPHNSKITWQHLLTQSSDWSGCLFDQCDWADRPPKTGTIDDWKNRPLIEPGTVFEYNDVRVNLLAYALLQVWRKPLPMVLKEKIMDPIGASSTWRWYGYEHSWVNIDGIMMQSVSGGGHFGGGLFISAEDQARFGLLFLRNGRWMDQQLLSPEWVKSVHEPSAAEAGYGLMWWTNRKNEFPGLSPEIYYANGFGGNFIVIDPTQDLVIVARWLEPSQLNGLLQLVHQSVMGK